MSWSQSNASVKSEIDPLTDPGDRRQNRYQVRVAILTFNLSGQLRYFIFQDQSGKSIITRIRDPVRVPLTN